MQDDLDFVDLPESYTELYSRAKSPHATAASEEGGDEEEERGIAIDTDSSVCLLCGQVKHSSI